MDEPLLIGMSSDKTGLICLDCFNKHQIEAQREGKHLNFLEGYDIGNPDGYTCASCGDEWYPDGYIRSEEE
jgi:hypothetical protein